MFVPKQGPTGNIRQKTFWCCFLSPRVQERGGGCRRTTFLVTANFLTSLAVAAFCLISSSSKSSYFCSWIVQTFLSHSQRCPAGFQYNSCKDISKHFCIAASRIELTISWPLWRRIFTCKPLIDSTHHRCAAVMSNPPRSSMPTN